MQSNPDSAIQILSKIDNPEELQFQEKADYWYLVGLSRNLKGGSMTDIPLIVYTLDYYKENGITDKLSDAYRLAAMYYSWSGALEKSVELLQDGLNFSLSNKDSINTSKFCYLLGDASMGKKDYRKAIFYYKNAAAYSFDNSLMYGAYYLVGLCFANIHQSDSTDLYMNRAIEMAFAQSDTISARHYLRNYADILLANKRYNEAIDLINSQIQNNTQTPVSSYITLSRIYLALNDINSAQKYLDKAKGAKYDDNIALSVPVSNSIMAIQSILNYAKKKDIDWTIMGRFNDSVWNAEQRSKLLFEEKVNAQNQLERKNLELTISKQRMQILLFYSLLLVVISVGAIYFYIRKKRMKLEEAEEKQETLRLLLDEAINKPPRQNDHFFKKVLLQQLGLIRLVATSPTAQNQELLRQMSLINNNEIPVDTLLVWSDLYNTIDSVYSNFHINLVSHFGDKLIDKEIQLCCLLCAEFSTKEISVVSQQSVRTIYQRKTTIRQKLHMDEKIDIVDFLYSNFK